MEKHQLTDEQEETKSPSMDTPPESQEARSVSPEKGLNINLKELNRSDHQIFMISPGKTKSLGKKLDQSFQSSNLLGKRLDQSFQSSNLNRSSDSQLKSELRTVFNKNLGNKKFMKQLADVTKQLHDGPL